MDRYALILTPTKDLINWVNEIFPEDPISYASILGHDGSDVFLIDEFYNTEIAIEWVRDNYLMFLEDMLMGWVEDDELWPELNLDLFEKFVDYKLQSVVYDISSTANDPDYFPINPN